MRIDFPTAVFHLAGCSPAHHWRNELRLTREGTVGVWTIAMETHTEIDPYVPFSVTEATVPHTVMEALCRRGLAKRLPNSR